MASACTSRIPLPKSIDPHVATDMKAGDTVHFQDGQAVVPDVNVYGFAYYIWQQINRWQADGATDYGAQIFRFQAYVTPSCRAQLEADLDSRYQAGELRRTRQMTEILVWATPPTGCCPMARPPGLLLDMQLMEAFGASPSRMPSSATRSVWCAMTWEGSAILAPGDRLLRRSTGPNGLMYATYRTPAAARPRPASLHRDAARAATHHGRCRRSPRHAHGHALQHSAASAQ